MLSQFITEDPCGNWAVVNKLCVVNHDNSKLTAYYLFSFKIFSRCERVHLRMHLFSVLPELEHEHVHKLTPKTEDPKNLKEKQKKFKIYYL